MILTDQTAKAIYSSSAKRNDSWMAKMFKLRLIKAGLTNYDLANAAEDAVNEARRLYGRAAREGETALAVAYVGTKRVEAQVSAPNHVRVVVFELGFVSAWARDHVEIRKQGWSFNDHRMRIREGWTR